MLLFVFAGGSIGEVSVTWSVDTARSTAVYGVDYLADGATLTFTPGETRKCKPLILHPKGSVVMLYLFKFQYLRSRCFC